MNNSRITDFPNVPENVPEWIVYDSLWNCKTDFGRDVNEKAIYQLARRSLLEQLKLMSNTKCVACSGYGHQARDCPTNDRLTMLGNASTEWRTLIAHCRVLVEIEHKDRRAKFIERPSYHSVRRGRPKRK